MRYVLASDQINSIIIIQKMIGFVEMLNLKRSDIYDRDDAKTNRKLIEGSTYENRY